MEMVECSRGLLDVAEHFLQRQSWITAVAQRHVEVSAVDPVEHDNMAVAVGEVIPNGGQPGVWLHVKQ